MNQLDARQLQVHVPVLGWLLVASNGVFLLTGAFLFLLLVGIGVSVNDPVAFRVLGIVGTLVGTFLGALGIPGVVAGIGLLARKAWGRILAIVVAILGLLAFPVGTIIGIYACWVLLQDQATEYFAPPQAS